MQIQIALPAEENAALLLPLLADMKTTSSPLLHSLMADIPWSLCNPPSVVISVEMDGLYPIPRSASHAPQSTAPRLPRACSASRATALSRSNTSRRNYVLLVV
jgi:hypothetical protein